MVCDPDMKLSECHPILSNDDFIFDGSANVGDGIIYGSSIDDQIVASAGNNFINAGEQEFIALNPSACMGLGSMRR